LKLGIIYRPEDFAKKKPKPNDIGKPLEPTPPKPVDLVTQLKALYEEIENLKNDVKKIKEALRSLGIVID